MWHLSATPSATRPSEGDICQQRRQQRVRLKTVEVREIFAYVRAIFDASEKVGPDQLRNPLVRLESVRLRPVEEFASSSALVFRIIDSSAIHAVVRVAIGVTDPLHGLQSGQAVATTQNAR